MKFLISAVIVLALAALIPAHEATKIMKNCAGMKPNTFDRIVCDMSLFAWNFVELISCVVHYDV